MFAENLGTDYILGMFPIIQLKIVCLPISYLKT
jgi:hypothetical protein